MAAAPTPSHTNQTWHVGGVTGRCASCGKPLPPGTACWATLCDRLLSPRTPMPSEEPMKPAEEAAPATDTPPVEAAPAEKVAKPKKTEKEKVAEESPFVRLDFCEECWAVEGGTDKRPAEGVIPNDKRAENAAVSGAMFSFWKTIVPTPEQKKKLFVDDAVLVDVFERMEGKTEPTEVRFRFVLALILMRKRLLRYEGMDTEAAGQRTDGGEVWRMKPRGKDIIVHIINPHLTQEQIAEVSQQLSAILAEEV